MNTILPTPGSRVEAIQPDVLADLEAVASALASGAKLDPELVQRIRARADQVRQEVYEEHGQLGIGVPAIREMRDGT